MCRHPRAGAARDALGGRSGGSAPPTLSKQGGTWIGWPGGKRTGGLPTDLGYDLRPVDLDADLVGLLRRDGERHPVAAVPRRGEPRPSIGGSGGGTTGRQPALRRGHRGDGGNGRHGLDHRTTTCSSCRRSCGPPVPICASASSPPIPFPAAELFARLPWRREVVAGLAGADVIGFQTPRDVENFRAGCRVERPGVDLLAGRNIDAFPISIDVAEWEGIATAPTSPSAPRNCVSSWARPRTVLLGIDRLDYTKGIEHRCSRSANSSGTTACASPTRRSCRWRARVGTGRPAYRAERLVSSRWSARSTGRSATSGRRRCTTSTARWNARRGGALPRRGRDARDTDRRRVELVAKGVRRQPDRREGALVLSEFAGAAWELDGAVLVNPHDIEGTKDAITTASRWGPTSAGGADAADARDRRLPDGARLGLQFLRRLEGGT